MSAASDSTDLRFPVNAWVPDVVVRSAQITQLYSQVRAGMLAAIVAAFALSALLWQVVPRTMIVIWLAVFMAVQILRHILLLRFRRLEPQGAEALPWGNWFLVGSGATSLLFGLSAVVMFPSDSLVHQSVLVCFLGGFAASTAVAHAPLTKCYVSSVLLSILPLLGRFVHQAGESGVVMAVVGLAFAAALLGTGNSLHKMIVTSIRLRFQRDEMVRNLQQAHEMLEGRVAERTAELERKNEELLKEVVERKRAEEAIRLEKTRFQALAEQLPLGLVAIAEDGSFHYANQKFLDLFGYRLEDLPDGRHWFRAAYPDRDYRHLVITSWLEDLDRAKLGEQRPREFTVTCRDGSEKTVLFRPVQLASGEHLMTCEDVTESRRAERALQEHLSMLEAILEKAGDGICVCHNIEEFPYVGFTHWNPRMSDITGYTMEEINESGWYQTLYPDPDIRQAATERMARMRVGDDIRAEEWTVTTKSGTERQLSISTSVIKQEDGRVHVLAIMQDVTARKKTDDAIKSIVEGVSGEIGEKFFDSSVVHFANILEADFTLIGEILHRDQGKVVRTLAFTAHGELQESFEYDLEGVPCEEVTKRDICSYRSGVAERFPQDEALKRRGVEAYVGVGLHDSKGEPMGIMAAMYLQPLKNVEFAEAVLRIFASRAASEIERNRAEEALRESEATLRSLIEAAPVGIGHVSANRTLGWTNQLLCTMLGYSREELAGQSARILYESEEEFLRVGREKHPAVIAHGSGSVETRFRRKDGSAFEVLLSSSSVVPGDLSDGIVFTVMDITERKRTEAQIRLNEARLQSLYSISQYKAETIQDLLDFTLSEAVQLTGSQVGYIYYYDEAKKLFELNTWSKEVMKECEVAEPPTLYELDKTGIWGEAVRQRKPIVVNDFQAPNPLKKGLPQGHVRLRKFMTIPVFLGDNIVAVIGVANKDADYDDSDVRQLALLMDSVWKIAEAKRSESEQRLLAAALESAGEGVVITDIDGTIRYVNPSLERMTGYSRDELLGRTPRVLKSGKQTSEFYEQLWRTICSGHMWTGTFVNRRKDGALYTEDATISPVRDSSGTVTNFVGTKRDISEQLALSKQLVHAQRMEAIGTLAGGIAHDFNNLLQAVLGYSELLLIKKGQTDPDRKKLEVIQHAARDGADLVARILTFSRKADFNTRPIDLNEEIRKAQRLLRRTIPRMIDIKLLLEDDLRVIEADPGQVEQVLLNLAVNAQHAMPQGGQLLIETSNVALGHEYLRSHLGMEPGHYVLLTVTDSGTGMAPEVLDRIFEPFFTTKTGREGTGLGLSIIHGIISQHGGHIRCYSEPGIGTTFKVYFPVSERELTPDLTMPEEMLPTGSETILLVDDDDRIREVGRQMVEMGGYQVITAKSGEAALDTYADRKDEISLVILDLIMPGIGGQRCLEQMLRLDPDVRVLVASGFSSNGVGNDQQESGARGFITKPYDAKEILTAIRRVIDDGHL